MQSIPNPSVDQLAIHCPIIAYLPDQSRPPGRRELNVWRKILPLASGDGIFRIEPFDETPIEIRLTPEIIAAVVDVLHNAARQYDALHVDAAS